MATERGQLLCRLSIALQGRGGLGCSLSQDLLGRMLGCAVFLDSNELSDLRRLFADGVRKSDTVILLATAGVLTRPWYVCRHAQSMREKYRPLPLFLRILTATRNCPNAKVLARTMGERQAVDSCHRRGG